MKTYTIVIEVYNKLEPEIWKSDIEQFLSDRLSGFMDGFRIMETIEAPYGPQHPGGVHIVDSHPYLCQCNKCELKRKHQSDMDSKRVQP